MTKTSCSKISLTGSMTALVTPFCEGEIDWPRLDALIDRQIAGGTDWLVPCGTTGESPTLTSEEQERFLEAVLSRSAGRCPVLAGTGSNSTREAVGRTTRAARAGANAVLVVAPYYNRPTQEGLFRHFAAVAEAVEIPVVMYNVPFRTGVEIGNDVVVRLREECPNIVAIKHATGSVAGVTDLLERCDIAVLSGDDSITWPMMSIGAVGVISVLGNLCPELLSSLVKAAAAGDLEAAATSHRIVYDIAEGMGRQGPNPLPIKTAMAICGLIREEFRLPLCPLTEAARDEIAALLKRHELIVPEDSRSSRTTRKIAPAKAKQVV